MLHTLQKFTHIEFKARRSIFQLCTAQFNICDPKHTHAAIYISCIAQNKYIGKFALSTHQLPAAHPPSHPMRNSSYTGKRYNIIEPEPRERKTNKNKSPANERTNERSQQQLNAGECMVLAAAFWCVEFGYGRRTNGERAAGCLGNGTSRCYSAGVASSRRACFHSQQRRSVFHGHAHP